MRPLIEPYGKIPPQDTSTEEKVLGAIFYGVNYGYNIMDVALKYLNEGCFYKDTHSQLFKAMKDIHLSGRKVTIAGIINKAKNEEWFESTGGHAWFAELGKGYMNGAMFQEHCIILYEIYVKRSMMQLGQELYQKAGSADPFEIKEMAEKWMSDIKIVSGGGETQNEVFQKTVERFEALENNTLVSIPTGWVSLDRFMGGWNKGDMIVIGSYSHNGKTSFAINTALHAASNKYPVKIYSMEMNSVELFKKQLALMVDHSPKEIEMDRRYREEFVKQAMLHLKTYPLYYENKCSYLGDWMADVKDSVKRGVQLVIVDYIQLMTANIVKSRAEDIGAIARGIKKLANELQIPIIAISQLTRPQGGGKAPAPTMRMLKESGEIEQSADVVIMPWIPSAEPTEEDAILYNNITTKTVKENGDRLMVIKVPKGRNYGTTKFLAYIDGSQKIYEETIVRMDHQRQFDLKEDVPF